MDLLQHLDEFESFRRVSSSKTDALVQFLASLILRGQLQPDERIPSTTDLARMLGLGRVTIQRALHRLMDQGLVSRRVGAGTFVQSVRSAPDRSGNSTKLVGLLHREKGYEDEIGRFEEYLAGRGYQLLRFRVMLYPRNLEQERESVRRLAEASVSTILYEPVPRTELPVPDPTVLQQGIRMICLTPHWHDMRRFDYVLPDFGRNAIRAAHELACAGVKRLFLVGVDVPYNYAQHMARRAALDFCSTIDMPAESCTPRQLADCVEDQDGVIYLIGRHYEYTDPPLLERLRREGRCILANGLSKRHADLRRLHNSFYDRLCLGMEQAESASVGDPIHILVPGVLTEAQESTGPVE